MTIQLKRFHIAFCIAYIPNMDSMRNMALLTEVNNIIDDWDGIEPLAGNEVVSLNVKGTVLADAWHAMSQEQEGKTSVMAREMVAGSEGFTGLEEQIMTLVNEGNEDAIIVAQKMQFLTANYAQQRADQIAANLAYLKSIFT